MRAESRKNPRLPALDSEQLPETLPGEATSPRGDKKIRTLPPFEQRYAAMAEISLNRSQSLAAHGNDPLLISLPHHPDNAEPEVDVRHANPNQFGYAKPGRVKEVDHRPIAFAGRTCFIRSFQ